MSQSNLKIDLYPHLDEDGNTYYVGKLKFNGSINFEEGVSFMCFISSKNFEQLQIAPMNKQKSNKQNGQNSF